MTDDWRVEKMFWKRGEAARLGVPEVWTVRGAVMLGEVVDAALGLEVVDGG